MQGAAMIEASNLLYVNELNLVIGRASIGMVEIRKYPEISGSENSEPLANRTYLKYMKMQVLSRSRSTSKERIRKPQSRESARLFGIGDCQHSCSPLTLSCQDPAIMQRLQIGSNCPLGHACADCRCNLRGCQLSPFLKNA